MEFSDFLKNLYQSIQFSPQNPIEAVFNPEESPENEVRMKKALKEIFQALSSDNYKLICVKGKSGIGKTHFLGLVRNFFEEKVLTYYYECSPATNLDDIILSLFNYLKKVTVKDREYIKNFKISPSSSIDERLINRVKKLEKPLLIFIDGIENVFNSKEEETKNELLNFLKFISSVPAIKIIVAGMNTAELEGKKGVYSLVLEGIEKEEALELIKTDKIPGIEEFAPAILEITGGSPENILLFSSFIKHSGFSPSEIIDKISYSGVNFEKLILEQVYNSISAEYIDLANFFILIRHALSAETLKKINFNSDIELKINYLKAINLLNENNNSFQIKQKFKNHLISKISKEEKIKIHTWLHELYSAQISAKLEQRILPVSRKLLYAEQYFHYKKLSEMNAIPDYDSKTKRQMEAEAFLARIEDDSCENVPYPREEPHFNPVDFPENEELIIKLSEEEKSLLKSYPDEEKGLNFETITGSGIFAQKEVNELESTEKELKNELLIYESKNDKLNYNFSLFRLANLYKEHFRHDEALKNYYSILNSEPEYIPENITIKILENLGEIYDYRREYDFSINYYLKALGQAEKQDNKIQKAEIYFKLALSYDDSGDYENALKFYHKNFETSENPEENQFLSASYSNAADIYDETGNPVKAIEFYKKSYDLDKYAHNPEGEYEVLSKLGNIYFETGNYTEARKCFYKELNLAKETEDPYKIAMSYIDIGDIFLFEKNYEKAVKAFILAKKSIDRTISTDSKEKIDRRFKQVIEELGRSEYNRLLSRIKAKND